jgi:alanine dehydrogenase
MDIGIPREVRDLDQRVGLGVNTVRQLVDRGNKVFVQTGAGDGAGFTDEEFTRVGATIVYSAEEVYKRAQLVCRVNTPTLEEVEEMMPGQIVCGFWHLAAASPQRIEKILGRGVTVFAYELLEESGGARPILRPMSEIAGKLVPQVAAMLLESPKGRGLLLSGIPGVPAAEVTIVGAGEVGFNAARSFAGLGAQVTVLDQPERLAEFDRGFDVPGRIRTMYSYPDQIHRASAFSNVLVGAILVPGERTPHVVTEEMVASMPPGAAIIDVSIDQGGCVETSRPTTLRDPSFVKHGVVHYCVPNFTALVARTASRALSNVLRPYLVRLADDPTGLVSDPALRSALVAYEGKLVHRGVAAAHRMQPADLEGVVR